MEYNLSVEENFNLNKHYYYVVSILEAIKAPTIINDKIIEDDSVFFRYINVFFELIADGRGGSMVRLKLDYHLDKIIRTEKLEETDIEQLFILKYIALAILKCWEGSQSLDDAIQEVVEIMRTFIDSTTRNYVCCILQEIDHPSYDKFKELYNNYFNA